MRGGGRFLSSDSSFSLGTKSLSFFLEINPTSTEFDLIGDLSSTFLALFAIEFDLIGDFVLPMSQCCASNDEPSPTGVKILLDFVFLGLSSLLLLLLL